MTRTDEDIAWAVEQLLRLSWMKGFSREDEALLLRAKSFLKLVYNLPIGQIISHNRAKNGIPEGPIELNPKFLETGATAEKTDVEWLIEYIIENLEEFPAPIQLRKFYCRFLVPADGIQPRMTTEEEQ